MTTANWMPCLAAWCVCRAICDHRVHGDAALARMGETLAGDFQITTRPVRAAAWTAVACGWTASGSLLGQFPADEALDRHADGLGQFGDRLRAILGLVGVRLLQQAPLAEERPMRPSMTLGLFFNMPSAFFSVASARP